MVPCDTLFDFKPMLLTERHETGSASHERLDVAFKIAKYMFADGESAESSISLGNNFPPIMHRLPYLLMNNTELALAFSHLILDSYTSPNLVFHMRSLRRRMTATLGVLNSSTHPKQEKKKNLTIGIGMSMGVQRLVYNVSVAIASDTTKRNLDASTRKTIVRTLCYFCRALSPMFITPYHMKVWGEREGLAYVLECDSPAACFCEPVPDAMKLLCLGIFKDTTKDEFANVWRVAEDAIGALRTPSPDDAPLRVDSTPPNHSVHIRVPAKLATSLKRKLEI